MSSSVAAAWLQTTYPDVAPRRTLASRLAHRLQPATLAVLRTRAFLLGQPVPALIEATEDALGRSLVRPSVALYSPSGMPISKVIHFVFEAGEEKPAAVAIAMADPSLSSRLDSELEVVEEVRRRLRGQPSLQACLPLEPLLVRARRDDLLVVLPLDPLAGLTGGDCREPAFNWLRDFQRATSSPERTWSASDNEREVALVERAWRRLDPDGADRLARRTRELLGSVSRHPFPCVAHGDFWRGNIAVSGAGHMRVFDWEWSEPVAHPAIDPLIFEAGDIRVADPRPTSGGVVEKLRRATDRVGRDLDQWGYDPRLATALLAPAIARLVERSHSLVNDASNPLVQLINGAESVLTSDR